MLFISNSNSALLSTKLHWQECESSIRFKVAQYQIHRLLLVIGVTLCQTNCMLRIVHFEGSGQYFLQIWGGGEIKVQQKWEEGAKFNNPTVWCYIRMYKIGIILDICMCIEKQFPQIHVVLTIIASFTWSKMSPWEPCITWVTPITQYHGMMECFHCPSPVNSVRVISQLSPIIILQHNLSPPFLGGSLQGCPRCKNDPDSLCHS